MTAGAHEHDDRLVETFLDLVRIDSPTGYEGDVARYCQRELEAVGCSVRFDDSAKHTGSDVGNLIAELPGTAQGVVVLSAHMDVVDPCRGVEPVIVDGVCVSAGDTVLGSDDKAGLAAAIEAVRRLSESPDSHPTVRCVFTVQEEIGLVGAKYLTPDDVAGDLCLVLDAAGRPGGIVTAAPTHWIYNATFRGIPAHAGVEPEKGVSAIDMAASAITKLPSGRLDERTTANVGSIKGGTATNVVAGKVEVIGECRSLDRDTVEALRARIDAVMHEAASKAGGTVEVEWDLQYEGFGLADDAEAVSVVSAACNDIGLTPRTYSTGGGSDANVIAAMGVVPTLALACGMDGVHGTSEQLLLDDLADLTALCVAVARRLV